MLCLCHYVQHVLLYLTVTKDKTSALLITGSSHPFSSITICSSHSFLCLRLRGCPYNAIGISRKSVFAQWFPILRRLCPRVPIIFDTVDLAFIREGRLALSQNFTMQVCGSVYCYICLCLCISLERWFCFTATLQSSTNACAASHWILLHNTTVLNECLRCCSLVIAPSLQSSTDALIKTLQKDPKLSQHNAFASPVLSLALQSSTDALIETLQGDTKLSQLLEEELQLVRQSSASLVSLFCLFNWHKLATLQ